MHTSKRSRTFLYIRAHIFHRHNIISYNYIIIGLTGADYSFWLSAYGLLLIIDVDFVMVKEWRKAVFLTCKLPTESSKLFFLLPY